MQMSRYTGGRFLEEFWFAESRDLNTPSNVRLFRSSPKPFFLEGINSKISVFNVELFFNEFPLRLLALPVIPYFP